METMFSLGAQSSCVVVMVSMCAGPHRPSEAVGHHDNSCLDKEGAALPETETLQLSLKLRPSQETQLTCLEINRKLLLREKSSSFQNKICFLISQEFNPLTPETSPATPKHHIVTFQP